MTEPRLTPERCEGCGRETGSLDGVHCAGWTKMVYAVDDCRRNRIDWRARALAAESEVKRLREALERASDALAHALEVAREGWSYAGDYFRQKWAADDDLAAIEKCGENARRALTERAPTKGGE